ncbi:MAG: hypothetical protein RDV48_18605 [Candidatus Eremiobacteraeota bacterium]|nr:hypothetical protein [Candidatus Eremiobacteraeota bacterium]
MMKGSWKAGPAVLRPFIACALAAIVLLFLHRGAGFGFILGLGTATISFCLLKKAILAQVLSGKGTFAATGALVLRSLSAMVLIGGGLWAGANPFGIFCGITCALAIQVYGELVLSKMKALKPV